MTLKRIVVFFLAVIILTGCSLPFTITWNTPQATLPPTAAPSEAPILTEAPIETSEPIPSPSEAPLVGTELNLGGIYMVLPPCLASGATGNLIPAAPYDEMMGPMEYYPAHRKIILQGYPLVGSFFDPADLERGGIAVYPVAEFVAMQATVAERVNAMQTTLAAQSIPPQGAIPLLPIFNAAEVFRAQEEILSFGNGSGVRYLTEYGQYNAPVNNQDLFYSFQGITTDGKYWVSALLPVNAAYLQADPDAIAPADGLIAPQFDDGAGWQIYYPEMVNRLNNTADNAYTPGLDCLDLFIQSLFIGD